MILDLDTLADDRQLAADVAIVGAGAVGLLLGTELARRGRSVMILESGGKQFESAAQSLNDATLAGRNHLGIDIGRARVLGGTSTLWGGQLTRFGAIDFEARPELGRAAWPIRLDDLRTYYRRTAALLGMATYTDDDRQIWDALHSAPAGLGDGFFRFNSSLDEHIANLKLFVRTLRRGALPPNIGGLPSHVAALGKVLGPLVVRYFRDRRMFNPSDLGISLLLQCEQIPLPESAVCLDESVDAHGIPRVRLAWKIDGRELETMAKFSEKLRAVLLKAGLARLEIDERLERRDAALLDDCKDINHQCGGLQMAERADHGVVDSDLKVHGADNLYVAGAAVFPSSSFANPTFTAMALSLRLADHLCGASYG